MPITVVAVLTAKPSRRDEIVDAFREVSPLVHAERGCELYAAHLQTDDGSAVVMVERWTTRADLEAHAAGTALMRLNVLLADVLIAPYRVWLLDPLVLGDPRKAALPTTSPDLVHISEEGS